MRVTCIMPFFNEGATILDILAGLQEVPSITQIICVDDGSTNSTTDVLEEKFPIITLIKIPQNRGKAEAVAQGLAKAENDLILLIDSDLDNVNAGELEKGIRLFTKRQIDMLIFKIKTTYARIDAIFNRYIIYSGTRIMRKNDLLSVMEKKPSKFQLETAINKYCIETKRRVCWIKCSAVNQNKMEKENFVGGFMKNASIMKSMVEYTGVMNQLQQMFFFCRKELT